MAKKIDDLAKAHDALKAEIVVVKPKPESCERLSKEQAQAVAVELQPVIEAMASAVNRLAGKGVVGRMMFVPVVGELDLRLEAMEQALVTS